MNSWSPSGSVRCAWCWAPERSTRPSRRLSVRLGRLTFRRPRRKVSAAEGSGDSSGPLLPGTLARLVREGQRLGEGQLQRSEEHTSELQSRGHLVCRLLLEKKKTRNNFDHPND